MRAVTSGHVFHEFIQYYDRNMLPLDITVMWCVWLSYEITTELLCFCSCFCPFHQFEHSTLPTCNTCQSVRWSHFRTDAEPCVCLLLCKWGTSPTHYRFGRWEAFFLWPLHAERKTFYGCRVLFPSSMSFIAGKKHQETREWGWLYQSLLCEHLRGIICPEFIAKGGTCWTTCNAVSLLPGRQMTHT